MSSNSTSIKSTCYDRLRKQQHCNQQIFRAQKELSGFPKCPQSIFVHCCELTDFHPLRKERGRFSLSCPYSCSEEDKGFSPAPLHVDKVRVPEDVFASILHMSSPPSSVQRHFSPHLLVTGSHSHLECTQPCCL